MSVPPDPGCDQKEALRGSHMARLRPQFAEVTEAMDGDLILFRHSRRALHVGYALDARYMLHIEKEVSKSMIERFQTTKWRSVTVGIYRHA